LTLIAYRNNKENMKTQREIAAALGIKQGTLSNIITGRRRPSWKLAKRLSEATCTNPELWLEGSPQEMSKAIKFQNCGEKR
jgi:plasmid maintenance system antidote protein VapI